MNEIIDNLEALNRKIESREVAIKALLQEIDNAETSLHDLKERRQKWFENETGIHRGTWYIADTRVVSAYWGCNTGDPIVIKEFYTDNTVRVGLWDYEWGSVIPLELVAKLGKR